MIDTRIYVIKGWRISVSDGVDSETINDITDQLSEVSDTWIDENEDLFIITDAMSGKYLYIGAILDSVHCDENYFDIEISNSKLEKKFQTFKDSLNNNPEIKNVLVPYIKSNPKTYVVYNVY